MKTSRAVTRDALALEIREGARPSIGDARAEDALVLDDDPRALTLDVANGLLEVGGGVSLREAARFADESGHVFPLGDTVPDLALSDACYAMPAFVDAFVASAELVLTDGGRASTPRAPRSATGPDLLGLALVDQPLAVVVRARIRVFAKVHASPREELYGTPLDVAMRVLDLMRDGRAFVVEAVRGRVRLVGKGPPSPRVVDDVRAFPDVKSARSIVPAEESLLEALTAGGRVVASPFMGRAAVYEGAPRAARIASGTFDVGAWRVKGA